MDSSSQIASSVSDDMNVTYLPEEEEIGEEEAHVHLPNPSLWPLVVGIAVGVAVGVLVLLTINSFVALLVAVVAVIFVLVGILGWALEDPFAPIKDTYITVYRALTGQDTSKFQIGQNVVDAQNAWLGKVQARFDNYLLVERGSMLPKVYYVPKSAIKDEIRRNTLLLTLSEQDLVHRDLTRVPDDLYNEAPESGVPVVKGAPQFARRPLSPAETGHYNYGRMWPGINTDASGSYHREEVLPRPQSYVTEDVYVSDRPIPERVTNPE